MKSRHDLSERSSRGTGPRLEVQLIAWVWLGMILGVSFLAAPAKFMAESLTLPVALDVGRATFGLFDRLEWLWTAALLAVTWRRRRRGELDRRVVTTVGLIVGIVIVQSLVFLPRLDERVALVIAGEDLPPSHLHSVSGAFEVVQAFLLLALGFFASSLRRGGSTRAVG
ncbi:MAG: hypothetical protein AAGC60_15880 [Acidobacteriota bacterium]